MLFHAQDNMLFSAISVLAAAFVTASSSPVLIHNAFPNRPEATMAGLQPHIQYLTEQVKPRGDSSSEQDDTRQSRTLPGTYVVSYSAGVRSRARGLDTAGHVMELLAPQRYPRPKKPMGNDIGVARLLEHTTMADPEKEVGEVFKSMPLMPRLKLQGNESTLPFYKDPQEESLDLRITELARQLAETGLRKQFEEKKLGHILPITVQEKNGKSFSFPVQTLPLVSRLPPETAQLQLIPEVQSIPQPIYREGFYPATPAPELSGPLLGGPPLKPKTRSIDPLLFKTNSKQPDQERVAYYIAGPGFVDVPVGIMQLAARPLLV